MPSLLNALGLDRLSTEERARLAQEIWDSLEAETEPLTEAQKRELDRRIAVLNVNPDAVTPWEVVEAKILSRIRR